MCFFWPFLLSARFLSQTRSWVRSITSWLCSYNYFGFHHKVQQLYIYSLTCKAKFAMDSQTKTLLQKELQARMWPHRQVLPSGLRDVYKVTVIGFIIKSYSHIKLNQIRNSRESIKYSTARSPIPMLLANKGIISWHLSCWMELTNLPPPNAN